MMNNAKRMLCSLAIGYLALPAWAQNLVPNWSFEEYTECPSDFSSFGNTIGWQSIGGSPDLLNECCMTQFVGVPASYLGYQEPATGNGYAGLGTFHYTDREFMQAELSAPLIAGIPAYVSMLVSPGGFGILGVASPTLASSGIGLRLSVNPLTYMNDASDFIFNTAVIYMANVLSDTSGWTSLTRNFVPDSAYRYVQIGNFFGEQQTSSEILNPAGDDEFAYAFIDNVCVSQGPDGCSVVAGTTELEERNTVISWRSTGNMIAVSFRRPAAQIGQVRLFDLAGRLIESVAVAVGTLQVEVPTSGQPHGLYLLQYVDQDNQLFSSPVNL